MDGRANEHFRLKAAIFVGNVNPDPNSPCIGIQQRIDKRDLARKCLARISLRDELHRLSVAQPSQVRLIRVENHPYLPEISYGVDAIADSYSIAFLAQLFDDDAAMVRWR